MDLDSSSKSDGNSNESSKLQEDLFETQGLFYSVDLSDLSENDQSKSDESIPYLCLPELVRKIPNNTDFQTRQATTKRIGNTNWCQCELCQPMESEAERLYCLHTRKVPDDYFEGYY